MITAITQLLLCKAGLDTSKGAAVIIGTISTLLAFLTDAAIVLFILSLIG